MIQVSRPCAPDFRFGHSNQCVAALDQFNRIDHYGFGQQAGRLGQTGCRLIEMLSAWAIEAAFTVHFKCIFRGNDVVVWGHDLKSSLIDLGQFIDIGQFDIELALPCAGSLSRRTRRRSGARNARLQSRHRYFRSLVNKSTNHSIPLASRNLSLLDPHPGHGIKSV